jgi:hypothetical protein
MCVINDEPWLYACGSVVLRTAPSKGAVTGLSYPSTPGFPGCRLVQVSPPSPAVLPRPQKPSCAVRVTLFRSVPRVGHVRLSPGNRSLGHCLPNAVSVSPNMLLPKGWPVCASHSGQLGREIGSKGGVAPPSAQRSRTSLIRGMRLQRLLGTRLATSYLLDWRSSVPFGVWFAGGGLPAVP